MPLKYHLVLRPDKRKDAAQGAKLYYGQVRSQQTTDFNRLCETISAHSTASKGDVMLVIDGLLYVLTQNLADGNVVQMGEFGNFRMVAGSTGTATEDAFTPPFSKKAVSSSPPAPCSKPSPPNPNSKNSTSSPKNAISHMRFDAASPAALSLT